MCLVSCILNTFKVHFKFSEVFYFYLVSYLSLGYKFRVQKKSSVRVVYLEVEDLHEVEVEVEDLHEVEDFCESLMNRKYLT